MAMFALYNILAVCVIYVQVHSLFIGDGCTLKPSGESGVCILYKHCQHAQRQLQKYNEYPQICGLMGTQSIVCCSKILRADRIPGEISKKMCMTYTKYVYETRESPILLINPKKLTNRKCDLDGVKLIVGGEVAGRKEFPHMAALGYESTQGDIQWSCGGTILSRHYILTAAHCLSSYAQGYVKWVKLGVTALNDTSHRQLIQVADRIAYPDYKSASPYHDIGLIKLALPANLNPFARPACLFLKSEVSAEKAIATGWGHTKWHGSLSNDLMKVTLDLFDHQFCDSTYKNLVRVGGVQLQHGIINDIQICAGSKNGENDTCQGDSGGPLQIYHAGDEIKCMYDIIGVTSFGEACNGFPGVYVRVSHYIKWIEDIVWP